LRTSFGRSIEAAGVAILFKVLAFDDLHTTAILKHTMEMVHCIAVASITTVIMAEAVIRVEIMARLKVSLDWQE
jgi:energy-converting hydrogenase Eha subunit E